VPTRRPAPNNDISSNLAYKKLIRYYDNNDNSCAKGNLLQTWTLPMGHCQTSNWPLASGLTATQET